MISTPRMASPMAPEQIEVYVRLKSISRWPLDTPAQRKKLERRTQDINNRPPFEEIDERCRALLESFLWQSVILLPKVDGPNMSIVGTYLIAPTTGVSPESISFNDDRSCRMLSIFMVILDNRKDRLVMGWISASLFRKLIGAETLLIRFLFHRKSDNKRINQ